MSEHTEGPWIATGLATTIMIKTTASDPICQVYGNVRHRDVQANANLIAAAPDMYELLRKFREDVAFDDFALSKFMEQVVSILDKLDQE